MKKLALLISMLFILTACSGEETAESNTKNEEENTKTVSLSDEFPKELVAAFDGVDIFDQKSIGKEDDISLISTGYEEGSLSNGEKITLLSNYSNTYTILEIESFIASTLLNDYNTLENPTKTFEWVLYADSIFLDYIKQMDFDELDRDMRKFYNGLNDVLIEGINNRDEIVQAWLDYSQGKKTKYTVDEIKLNLGESNMYMPSISIGLGLATMTTEKIGEYDVTHYTKYGYDQIALANEAVKRMLLKYYELAKLPSGVTLNHLVAIFKEEETWDTVKSYEQEDSQEENFVSYDEQNNAQDTLNVTDVQDESILDEIPQGSFNTVETTRTQIGYLIAAYLDMYTGGDTASLEFTVHPSSQFYQDQISYMNSLQQRGMRLEVIDYSLLSMDVVNQNKYHVTTEEYYTVNRNEQVESAPKQISKYTVELIDGEFYITDLELL